MKRGIVFSKYGTLAASTRQRFIQVVPHLKKEDIEIDIYPLFDNRYLEALFCHNQRKPTHIIAAYTKRFFDILSAKKYDFLWVHCELFPYLPGFMESLAGLSGKPVIYDYDDAIFHQYDAHKNEWVRKVLGNKLAPLLQHSDLAFCGNRYLEAYAKKYCEHTEIIPTTVDTSIYTPSPKTKNQKPIFGWIGSPSTWNYCLPFADVFKSSDISMLVIGAGKNNTLPFEFRDWAEAHEVKDIQEMDIGIMPIPDEPWARGKCGYKLIQYMACGLPVIASPVGVNSEIVEHGVNGFLASTKEEWRDAIHILSSDLALREKMGTAGRKKIEDHYSIQVYGPKIAELIQRLLYQS